ncbi:MAG TPA: universal stress protein [Anaerolineae bacterium]|nr:universal stress protein [Anaerolineae bacterium]
MQLYENILIPLDGSDLAATALPHATTIATTTNANLHLLQVLPTPIITRNSAIQQSILELAHGEAEDYLHDIRRQINQPIAIHVHVSHGRTTPSILDYITDHAIDLIVMSSHGHTGLAKLRYGSIAEELLQQAPCPILLVRHNDKVNI